MLAADDNQIVSVYQAILYQINSDIAISYWILALAKLWCLMSFAPHVRIWISVNPFAPGDFVEKRVLKLVKWFSGHCRAIKS